MTLILLYLQKYFFMFHRRELELKIAKHLEKKEFTIVVGARQIGKTSLLKYIMKDLKEKGKKSYFLTLEDAVLLKSIDENAENLFNYIPKTTEGKVFLILDEIQYLKNPSNFLKYMYDVYADNLKILATGSSAFYIDQKFTDSLAGRKRIFRLHPLNFQEYLTFNSADELIEELDLIKQNINYKSIKHNEIQRLFFEYLTFGGYPKVALEKERDEKIMILEEIKNSFIKRDIQEANIAFQDRFYQLLRIMASQVGDLVNKNELANTLGISGKTIDNYFYVMQKCFQIELVSPFFTNVRKELIKMPKIYFNDIGLRNSLLNDYSFFNDRFDKGKIFENHVFHRLRAIYTDIGQINYWRTQQQSEVDFVVTEQFEKGFALEVKFSEKQYKASKYKLFKETYPNYPLKCIGFEKSDNKDYLSIWEL